MLRPGCGGSSGSSDETWPTPPPVEPQKAEAAVAARLPRQVREAGDGRVAAASTRARKRSVRGRPTGCSRRRHRRPAALRPDLELDQGEPARRGRAHRLPLEERRDRRPQAGIRRRPGCGARAAHGVVPLRPPWTEDTRGSGSATAILTSETTKVADEPLLVAGPWARTPKVIFNPSYFSPATYAALGQRDRRCPLERPGRELAGRGGPPHARPGRPAARLGASIKDAKPVASGPPTEPDADPAYGFDAVRHARPLRGGSVTGGPSSSPRAPGLRSRGARRPTSRSSGTPSGKPAGKTQHPVALRRGRGGGRPPPVGRPTRRSSCDAAAGLDRGNPTYYGAAWVALGRMMLDTHALNCR